MNQETLKTLLDNAMVICASYSKGNGKFETNKLPSLDTSDVDTLTALGIYTLAKLDTSDALELLRLKAVSAKHATLLASQLTGKYDFTALLKQCMFINKIDTNLQSFIFKRETKTIKVDLMQLKHQLSLMGLELIKEELNTRSGNTITNYFYDIKPTKEEV